MADTFEKTPEGNLKVTKKVTEERVVNYTLEGLIKQKIAIQQQWDRDNEQRQKEIDEVDLLIAEAKKLGIEEKSESDKIKDEQ